MSFMKETVAQSLPVWDACLNSPFIRELKEGTLPQEKFRLYMIQDSIYLKHYDKIIERWEQIYLTEGPEGLAIERRGRGSKGVRQSSCRSRQKKICWQKSSGCVRRTIT